MGGLSAQLVALTVPHQVRKLLLMATTAAIPREGSDVGGIVWPREEAPPGFMEVLSSVEEGNSADVKHTITHTFFYQTDDGREAAQGWWNRINERKLEAPLLAAPRRQEHGSASRSHE